MRRIAVAFGVFLFLSALGASTLVSMLFRGYGPAGTAVPGALIILLVLFLAGSFSLMMRRAMTARLEAQDRRRRQLLADIAHELRTPVAVLQAGHEAMLDGLTNPTPDNLSSLRDETLRLAKMVDDLQRLALAEAAALQLKLTSSEVERALTAVGSGAANSILNSARDAQTTLVAASTEASNQIKSLSADVERTLSAAGSATAASILAGAREVQTTLVTASSDAANHVKTLATDVQRSLSMAGPIG